MLEEASSSPHHLSSMESPTLAQKKGFAAFSPSELTTITICLAKHNAATTTGFWDHLEELCISTGFNGMNAKILTKLILAISQVKRETSE